MKKNEHNKSDTFNKLESQLKSLLQRAVALASSSSPGTKSKSKSKSKSKNKSDSTSSGNSNPPDEASFALGQQSAIIYSSIYFQCCRGNDNRDSDDNGGEDESKVKSKWKQVGFDFIENVFCQNEVDDAFISAFFNVFADEMVEQIKKEIKPKGATQSYNHFVDDVCYWWVAVISTCEKAIAAKEKPLLSSSIRGYLKFVLIAILYINNSTTGLPSFRNKVLSNTTIETTTTTDNDDHVQLVRIYYKLQSNDNRQFLIRELISALFHTMNTSTTETSSYTSASKEAITPKMSITSCHLDLIVPLLTKIMMTITATKKAANTSASHKYHELLLSSLNEERNALLLITNILNESSFLLSLYSHQNVNNIHDNSKEEGGNVMNVIWNVILPWLTDLCFKKMPSLRCIEDYSLDFTCQLCDFITMVVKETIRDCTSSSDIKEPLMSQTNKKRCLILQEFVNTVLNEIHQHVIPSSSSISSSRTTTTLLLIRVNNLLALCNKDVGRIHNMKIRVSSGALYHATMTALLLHDKNDIALQLEILSTIISSSGNSYRCDGDVPDDENYTPMMWALLYCVGTIFMTTSQSYRHKDHARSIVQIVNKELERKTINYSNEAENTINDKSKCYNHSSQKDSKDGGGAATIFLELTTTTQKLNLLSSISTSASSYSTTYEQCEMLLLGLSMLVYTRFVENENDKNMFNDIYSFLNRLLEEFPHLGRRSLPILKAILHHLVHNKMGDKVQKIFEFLCNSVARDPSCAHEVWTMISTMKDPSLASVQLQCMVLRLYPLLCNANKRLYGRICESIGTYISHPNSELRVVAALTICELAKRDIIRDVSDVIGWVQSFLGDEESMIVYYAILTLHYLVLASELDYIIVLKVLNKKLVKFDEGIDEIFGLKDDLVIEALVKFLGNGETDDDDDDSSSESDEDEKYEKSIPPHTQMSITTLCSLALAYLPETMGQQNGNISKMHILNSIYVSLSQYSVESFDIDEDLICVDYDEDNDNRYFQLKRVIDAGNQLTESSDYFSGNARFESTMKDLTLRLEQIEHKSPVALRWIQNHRKK